MNYAMLTARRRALPPPVVPTVVITQQPANQTASLGAASFSIAATTNFGGAITYQWQKSDNGGSTFSNISGASSSTLSLSGLISDDDNGDLYRVVVSSIGADSVTSNSVTLTVASGWQKRGQDLVSISSEPQMAFSADGNVIGIADDTNSGTEGASKVAVYDWSGSAWTARPALLGGNSFGYQLALSRDGAVVAVGGSDFGDEVNVYAWNGSAWSQRGPEFSEGWSVALSSNGTTLAVATPGHDFSVSRTNSGRVRVYDWSGSTWTQRGDDFLGESSYILLGVNIDISADGDSLAIADVGSNGRVRVYDWSGSAWTQRGSAITGTAGDPVADGLNEIAVKLSANGDVVAIGYPGHDGAATNSGHVRVFAWDGSVWTQRGASIERSPASTQQQVDDSFGIFLSISDDGSVVAAKGRNYPRTPKIMRWSGTDWVERSNADLSLDGAAGIAISGDGLSVTDTGRTNSTDGDISTRVSVYRWS
jgi:hypothetical protein